MTKEILIILACVPLFVVNSFCDKCVSSKSDNKHNFLYNCLKFLLGSLCLLPMFLADDTPKLKLGVVFCGIACGVMYAVSKTIILKGYEKTSVAFMTFCHASGMIIPCVIGHFFWSEKLSVWSAVGIILAIASIFHPMQLGVKTHFGTAFLLIAYIDLRSRVLAHNDHCQPGLHAGLLQKAAAFLRDLLAHFCRNQFAVDQYCHDYASSSVFSAFTEVSSAGSASDPAFSCVFSSVFSSFSAEISVFFSFFR